MKRPGRNFIFGGILLLAVVICIVIGVVLLGPPAEWRGRRLDEYRVSDLRELSFAIDEHYSRHGTLPSSLDELALDAPWTAELVDPQTRNLYTYRFVEPRTYELCADFAHGTATGKRADYPHRSLWSHSAGRHCLRLTVQTGSREVGR